MNETGNSRLLRGRFVVRCVEMKRGGARSLPLLAAALVAATMLTAPAPAAAVAEPQAAPSGASVDPRLAGVVNGVAAVVDGDPITVRDIQHYRITSAPFLAPEIRADWNALIDSMIERRLLAAEFRVHGITASDTMVERYIETVLEESGQKRADLDAALAKVGLSWTDYFERMRDEVQRLALINMIIRARVNVPDEEVRRVWETDPDLLDPPKREVAAIVLPLPTGDSSDPAVAVAIQAAQAQAVEVQREARRNFASAAKKYSKGPAADEGGGLGEFQRGTMAPHFEKALEGLRKGDVSAPIEGPGALYIVKLVDEKSAARRPYEEVKDRLRDRIYDQRLQERYRKWAEEDLRRDHRVEILLGDLVRLSTGS